MKKGSVLPIALMAFAIVAFILLVDLAISPKQNTNHVVNHNTALHACTLEARLCPDGSYVGRQGPNCEFAACPGTDANANVNTSTNTNTATNTNTSVNTNTSTSPTADWNTYTNTKYGYSVEYPKDWRVIPVTGAATADGPAFASPTTQGDTDWGIIIISGQTVDQVIADVGSQWSDRKESRETVTFNGITATKATVTTNQYPNWKSVDIVFAHSGKVFHLTNGAIDRPAFVDFYQSFTFTQ